MVLNQPPPYVITAEYILRKFAGCAPSLILHLHPTHFRFDQQDGNFGYNSEMRLILEHVQNKTVPHEILAELFASGVKFYDGCLIVEIHNHRVGVDTDAANAAKTVGSSTQKPYSIHNWNAHITPSPYVPYPEQSMKDSPSSKAAEKQPMPAPDQPASAMQKKASKMPKIFTTVLFSTQSSLLEEMNILARTEYEKPGKRLLNGQSSKDGATPHPPTPLTSVPPTPLISKGSSKHPQMILTEDNAHEWEAEVINRTAPPLFLDPAIDFAHSQQLIEQWEHPLHCAPPPAPKARKRTTAELAADEAQAASEERFMLAFDERHSSLLASGSTGGAADAGRSGVTGTFEADFKPFKVLENVRMQYAERERAKKEQEAEQASAKRQRQEAESAKRRERAEQDRQMQQQSQQRQAQQQENLARQQQIQQAQRAAAEHAQSQQQTNMSTPVTANPQQIPMSMSMPQASHLQASQATQMSPINRQQTPMSASPVINGTPMTSVPMTSVPMTSVPMATSLSNQAAGSPARPPSAMQQHHQGLGMVRQQSQQHPGSNHGTPQVQNTPSMPSAVPVTRHQTPTPRVNQGSPMAGQMQHSTPSMMPSQLATPTGQQFTPEQRQHMLNQQRLARQAQQMQQMGNPISQQQQNLIIQYQQQQQQLQHQQRIQQMNGGTPTPQGGMQHNMSQAMQMQNSQMNNPQMQQMNSQRQQQNPIMNSINQRLAAMKQQYQNQYMSEANNRSQQFMAQFGGLPPPPDRLQQFQQQELSQKQRASLMIDQKLQMQGKQFVLQAQEAQRASQTQQALQMQGGGQHNGMMNNGGQNQQMMQNGQGMQMQNTTGGGMMVGQQNAAAQQAYLLNMQQQRQQMVARQRQMNMQHMGAQQQQQGGQQQGMMNGMSTGLPNTSNGNMGGQMGMGVGQMGMNGQMGMGGGGGGMGGGNQMPQGMGGMPNTANMNPQQMMQLQQQMMVVRQQQMNMGNMGQNGMGGGMM
ncbi:transcription factor spt20 [Venturia nashicola]|nr:transcription factor spt20 [Venturia nashicola]